MNNVDKVFDCLKKSGPMRQKDIVKATGVKNVYQIITDFVKKGVAKRNGLEVSLTGYIPEQPDRKSLLKQHIFSLYAEVSFLENKIEKLTSARAYLLDRIDEANKKAEATQS